VDIYREKKEIYTGYCGWNNLSKVNWRRAGEGVGAGLLSLLLALFMLISAISSTSKTTTGAPA
jgi:hypothetical protein